MSLPRLVLAANARPGVGGQGVSMSCMVEAVRDDFDCTVHCQEQYPGLPGTAVGGSAAASLIQKLPIVRRRRDWITTLHEVHFDSAVAARLEACDIFHGATGQCAESIQRARQLGARIAVDSVTWHAAAFGEVLDRSCAEWGIRPPLDAAARSRMEREYQNADIIRVMSPLAARTFVDRGIAADRLVVVPPWIDMVPAPESGRAERPFTIGFVGLLEPWKGFQHLVEAYGALGIPGAELVLWGSPGSRPVSRYMAAALARWPGIRLRDAGPKLDYAAVYGSMDVMVHPSLTDGFGLVVAEAMACGVPVICSTASGVSWLVEDGISGCLVPPGDRDAIVDRLGALARDPDLRAAMGAAARQRASLLTRQAARDAWVPPLRALLQA